MRNPLDRPPGEGSTMFKSAVKQKRPYPLEQLSVQQDQSLQRKRCFCQLLAIDLSTPHTQKQSKTRQAQIIIPLGGPEGTRTLVLQSFLKASTRPIYF